MLEAVTYHRTLTYLAGNFPEAGGHLASEYRYAANNTQNTTTKLSSVTVPPPYDSTNTFDTIMLHNSASRL
jgi:hypothetical protein